MLRDYKTFTPQYCGVLNFNNEIFCVSPGLENFDKIGMRQIKYNKLTWVDIKGPKEKDLDFLRKTVKLHPSTIHQYLPSLKRSKVESFDNYLFIVFHFPVFSRITRCTVAQELDIILTKNLLITSHKGELPALNDFFNGLLLHDPLRKRYFRKTISHIFFHLLDNLIDSCLPMLDHISENIDNIENQVFKNREKEIVSEICVVKRDIVNFERIIKPQEAVLKVLSEKISKFFPREKTVNFYSEELLSSQREVRRILDIHWEMIHSLDSTNQSLLSYKTSSIMRILTIISFITFPLGVIAGFFGMNIFHNLPFINNPYTFWMVILSMIAVVITMVIYFKKKRWL